MKVDRTSPTAFKAQFETEEELREEHRTNLAFNALRLVTTEDVPVDAAITLTLIGPEGGTIAVKSKVVTKLADGIALMIEGDPEEILKKLLERGAAEEDKKNQWDRIRGQSQMEKILQAVKADRADRAVLIMDSDPRVLMSLLRNPRLTVDEVVRLAKASTLTYHIAEVIMKTGQWMASVDVRVALVHNSKTPQPFALRILPTLPENEIRAIARAGTNMALKQAAAKRLSHPPGR
jgi:hypothetical protein